MSFYAVRNAMRDLNRANFIRKYAKFNQSNASSSQ